MIESYRKLLRSFKKSQLSKYIETVQTKALAIIKSEYASKRITSYFEKKKSIRKGSRLLILMLTLITSLKLKS
jgi:hypothetical protein